MITKFKTKEVNGEIVLIKTIDTKETIAICPFSQPLALPGQLQGQIQLIPRACGNNCALFEIYGNEVLLKCKNLNISLTSETSLLL